MTISGTDTPTTNGQTYTFNHIEQADSYQLEVASISAESWTEGAEDNPVPWISEGIAAGYTLRQTGLFKTGSKAFQLTFPSGVWTDQSFTVTRDIIPSAASQLQYYDFARFTTTTTTLEAQISTDGGTVWTTLASRNGVNLSGTSSYWDTAWQSRSASLAAYAGQPVQLRFIMKRNGGTAYQGVDSSYGFFIDDITVTNATQLTNPSVTSLVGGSTSFILNSAAIGTSITAGSSYIMRIRPNVGSRWFSYGAMKTVTAVAGNSFATWAAAYETAHSLAAGTLSDPNGDYDGDGRSNLIEYAFGGSPVADTDAAATLPVPSSTATHLVLRYQRDTSLTDLTFTPQASPTMETWKAPGETGAPAGFTDELVSTEGSLETREAKLPRGTATYFLRVQVTRQ